MNYSMQNAYVCEMSWACALVNPCQNFGACTPVTDGATCSCYPGTSGAFCEKVTTYIFEHHQEDEHFALAYVAPTIHPLGDTPLGLSL
uniref:EGF-like domain-containing protein n=1 Tax=Romanomermis culicivorax TaxID=13658 RepID=A0A915IT57_ROMCU